MLRTHIIHTYQQEDKASVIHSVFDRDIQFSELLHRMKNSTYKEVKYTTHPSVIMY